MRVLTLLILLVFGASGCTTLDGVAGRLGLGGQAEEADGAPVDPFIKTDPAQEVTLTPETAAPPPPPGAQTAAALDTTTADQRAAATAPPTFPTTVLGTTIVSLGSPTEPGLWLKTPLVKEEGRGRVTNRANGKSSLVTLIPIEGPETGGSRLSLAAMRLIEASLTDLTEVEVALES